MNTITIKTLMHKGEHIPLTDELSATYPPRFLKEWSFDYEPVTAQDEIKARIEASKREGLFLPSGAPRNMEAFRYEVYLRLAALVVKDWRIPGQPAEATGETPKFAPCYDNIAALPGNIVIELGLRLTTHVADGGKLPTPEELEEEEARLAEKKGR